MPPRQAHLRASGFGGERDSACRYSAAHLYQTKDEIDWREREAKGRGREEASSWVLGSLKDW